MAGMTGSLNVGALLVFGTFNSLFSKIVYQLQAPDCSGQLRSFEKPWFQTAVMFVSMTLCLPIAFHLERRQRHKDHAAKLAEGEDAEQPLLQDNQQQGADPGHPASHGSSGWQEAAWLAVPTLFDLTATTLMNIGLLYVTASVFQMLRGAEMVFAALFAVLLLHRHLNRWHFLGIAACVVGISLVGSATLLTGEKAEGGDAARPGVVSTLSHLLQWGAAAVDPKLAALGMGLIVASQAVQAGQITLEDHFMADLGMHPLKVVGYEGVLGTLLMLGVALPVLQVTPADEGSGLHEDTWDTLCMLRNSRAVMMIQVASVLAMLMYNISGMLVTDELGASARTVLETTRTLFVWLGGLALFYSPVGHHQLGEPWASYSWIQAGGFAVLVGGTLVYSRGTHLEAAEAEAAGRPLKRSKWALLKHTLPLWTGHVVTPKQKLRAAARTVVAVQRLQDGLRH